MNEKIRGSFRSQGEDINFILYKPGNGTTFPGLIFHPGNRLFPEDYEWLLDHLTDSGYAVLAIYQRGYGSGENEMNDRAGPIQQQDLQQALNFLQSLDYVQKDRIGAIGHSNGAGLVMKLAAYHKKIKCVVCLSMISDWGKFISRLKYHLPEYYQLISNEFRGSPNQNKAAYEIRSCLLHAANVKVPVCIMVGKDDTITPPYQSIWMTEALKESGNERVTLSLVPDTGHFFEKYNFAGYETEIVADEVVGWVRGVL